MKKNILYFFAAVLLAYCFSSCSKEDDCDIYDEESPCYSGAPLGDKLLIVETKINGKKSSIYKYDNQNRPTVITTYDSIGTILVTTTYTYLNKNYPTTVRSEYKNGEVSIKEYSYGNNERPVSAVVTFPNNSKSITQDHQYAYSKNRIVETVIPRKKDQPVYVNTYNYDEKGNLLAIEFVANGVLESKVEQSNFDNKNSVNKYGNPEAWMFPGVNNHQSLKGSSQLFGVTVYYTYKYTYNDSGYPIKAEVYDNLSGKTLKETIEYIYRPL